MLHCPCTYAMLTALCSLQNSELLEQVLRALDHDKRGKARALNHVNTVTQQTPLSLVSTYTALCVWVRWATALALGLAWSALIYRHVSFCCVRHSCQPSQP